MTPKEYFEKCLELEHDHETIEEQKKVAYSSMLGVSKLQDDKVSSTPTRGIEDRIVEWVEWREKLDEIYIELVDYKMQVMSEMNRLDDSLQRRVLQGIYIDGKKFKEVAEDIEYSERQTQRFCEQGLLEFGRLYPEKFSS